MSSEPIETIYGQIDLSDVPHITLEPFEKKIERLAIFYTMIVVIFIAILYRYSQTFSSGREPLPRCNVEPIPAEISAQKLTFYGAGDSVKNIHNIVLLDGDRNIIDIDIKHNYFVKKYITKNGMLYSIDFGKKLTIQEVIILRNTPDPSVLYIDAYDENETAVWHHGELLNSTENTIQITIV